MFVILSRPDDMLVALIVEDATIAHACTPVRYGAGTAPRVDSVL